MKTNDELDELARQIYLEYDSDDLPAARKLLRSIEIDALREAREIMRKEASRRRLDYAALPELDKLIRELELK